LHNIILIVITTALNTLAQILMKYGMLQVGGITSAASLLEHLPAMAANVWLYLSLACYGASAVLWMVVLSRVAVSFAYPFLSIGFVAALFAGRFLFHEKIPLSRAAGVALICSGIFFVARR